MLCWIWCGASKRKTRSAQGNSPISNKHIIRVGHRSSDEMLLPRRSSFLLFSSLCAMFSQLCQKRRSTELLHCFRSSLGNRNMSFYWTNSQLWLWVRPSLMTWIWLQYWLRTSSSIQRQDTLSLISWTPSSKKFISRWNEMISKNHRDGLPL